MVSCFEPDEPRPATVAGGDAGHVRIIIATCKHCHRDALRRARDDIPASRLSVQKCVKFRTAWSAMGRLPL